MCEGQEGLLDRASLQNLLQVSWLTNQTVKILCVCVCLTCPHSDQLAARLNAKLNYVPGEGGEPLLRPVEEGGIFQKYEEELEINDFPQQARYEIILVGQKKSLSS